MSDIDRALNEFILRDAYFRAGYHSRDKELETTKKLLDDAVILLNHSRIILESEGYDFFTSIKNFLAKLSKGEVEL